MSFTIEMFDGTHLILIPDDGAVFDPIQFELFKGFPEQKWRNNNNHTGFVIPISEPTLNYLGRHWIKDVDYTITDAAKIMMNYQKLSVKVDTKKAEKRWQYLFNDTVTGFNYPSPLPPFDHQRVTVEAMYGAEYFGLLMEMGTGKSKCVVDEIGLYGLSLRGDENLRIIVTCPKALMVNWEREFKLNFPDVLDYAIQILNKGDLKAVDQIHDLLNETAQTKIILVSQDSVATLRIYLRMFKPTMLVVDESHYLKNPETKRWKAIKNISEVAAMRRILTGSPTPNNVMDLWAQFEILKPAALGYGTYSGFKHAFAKVDNYSGYETVEGIKDGMLDKLREAAARMSFIVKKSQCMDLPEKQYDTIETEMPPAMRDLYDEFRKNFLVTLENGNEVKTEFIIVQMLKLSQICSGFVSSCKAAFDMNGEVLLDDQGDVETTMITDFIPGGDTKLNLMIDDAIECMKESKLIIWSRFRLDLFVIEQRLKERGIQCGRYDGTMTTAERQYTVDQFRDNSDFRCFIGSPKAGGVGLTLLGYDPHTNKNPNDRDLVKNVFYYNNDFNFGTREQSEDRCHRIGVRQSVMYKDYVYSRSIEQFIASRLQSKKDFAESFKNVGEIKALLLGDVA